MERTNRSADITCYTVATHQSVRNLSFPLAVTKPPYCQYKSLFYRETTLKNNVKYLGAIFHLGKMRKYQQCA